MPPPPVGQYAPNAVLVRLKEGAAARRLLMEGDALAGLQLQRYVGDYQTTPVPPAAAGASLAAAAAAVQSAPPGAVLRLRITDGSSVEAKLAQLRQSPGAAGQCRQGVSSTAGARSAGWAHSPPSPPRCLARPAVDVAEPDSVAHPDRLPSDTYYHGPYALWHLNEIQAPSAWNAGTGSAEVGAGGLLAGARWATARPTTSQPPCRAATAPSEATPLAYLQVAACVIDSGVAPHEDLAVAGGWNRGCLTGPSADCALPMPGVSGPNGYDDYTGDVAGHGTHVAGILGALGGNALGVAGVTWNVSQPHGEAGLGWARDRCLPAQRGPAPCVLPPLLCMPAPCRCWPVWHAPCAPPTAPPPAARPPRLRRCRCGPAGAPPWATPAST